MSKNKKSYRLSDEILIEVTSVYNIKLRDFGIYPETQSEAQIKLRLLDLVKEGVLEGIEDLKPIMSRIELIKGSAVTKSILYSKDKEKI